MEKLKLILFISLFITANNIQGNQMNPIIGQIVIDTISVKRNWMTWEWVITNELEFQAGDSVTQGAIDTSINKIWNIDNFADVKYTINKLENGKNHLEISALDALKLIPIVSINHSSKENYNIGLGIEDANFIGSNILLKIKAGLRPTGNDLDFRFGIPRQHLYENMTLELGTVFGNEIKRHVERNEQGKFEPTMTAPYEKTEIYGTIGNPWQLDYKYRLSPDLSWRFRHHKITPNLLTDERDKDVMVEPYTLNMLELNLSESIGTVNTKRHRKDGYKMKGGLGLFFGLDEKTHNHQSLQFEAEYHKTLNNLIQLTTWYKTGFTNTALKALAFCRGWDDVIGHRVGEIGGSAFYAGYLGIHLTWFNKSWFSLENAYFLNWGNGADNYFNLYTSKQKAAVGSTLRFQIPAFPFLYVQFTFNYSGPGREWFNIKNS